MPSKVVVLLFCGCLTSAFDHAAKAHAEGDVKGLMINQACAQSIGKVHNLLQVTGPNDVFD